MSGRTVSAIHPPRSRQAVHQALQRPSRRRLGRIVLPSVLGLVLSVLVLLPIFFMVLGSVRSAALADPAGHFTLAKLALVYTTLPYLRMLGSSIAIATTVGVIATVVGVALAWLMSRTDIPAKGLTEGAIMAPLFLSPFVGAIAWLILASPRAGLLNAFSHAAFGADAPTVNVASLGGILFVMTLYYIPYAYLTVSSSLRSIDPSMEEAS
jgi:iron(III) transport system permease protein